MACWAIIAALVLGATQLVAAEKYELDWRADFEPSYEVWQPETIQPPAQVVEQTFKAARKGVGGLEIDVRNPSQSWHVQFRVSLSGTSARCACRPQACACQHGRRQGATQFHAALRPATGAPPMCACKGTDVPPTLTLPPGDDAWAVGSAREPTFLLSARVAIHAGLHAWASIRA
jgi:hypothetical protein